MTRFLQSGRRRDICILLADESRQAQALKSRLESHYDERIEPRSFYSALDTLVENGFVETETKGIHDVYVLTEAGRDRLVDHLTWALEHVDLDDDHDFDDLDADFDADQDADHDTDISADLDDDHS